MYCKWGGWGSLKNLSKNISNIGGEQRQKLFVGERGS